MAVPPDDLRSYLSHLRTHHGAILDAGGALALALILRGWLDHRSFVARDSDQFAHTFEASFDGFVRERLGDTAPRWEAVIARARRDPAAQIALAYQLIEGFTAAEWGSGPPVPGRTGPPPEDWRLHRRIPHLARHPGDRPGDGTVAAYFEDLPRWLVNLQDRGITHRGGDFLAHWPGWLAWHSRLPETAQVPDHLARLAHDHEDAWQTLARLARMMADRQRAIADKWGSSRSMFVVDPDDPGMPRLTPRAGT